MTDTGQQLPAAVRMRPTIPVLLAAVSLFVAVYLAVFLATTAIARTAALELNLWLGLLSAGVATWVTVRLMEHGAWRVGFFVPPRDVLIGVARGFLLALILIGAADLLILATTGMRHSDGDGFPWLELVLVFIPAALHEEVLFRGYVFQRILSWRRDAAIAFTALVFGLLHAGNRGITVLAVANITLAGVLLALAYERFRHLWYPIGIHFAWNLFSGPVLGYRVSGYPTDDSVLDISGHGPQWLTGGAFGIEGSAWMLITQAGGIAWLWWVNAKRAADERIRPREITDAA